MIASGARGHRVARYRGIGLKSGTFSGDETTLETATERLADHIAMMNVLYQALKALDPHTFEQLIVHLLKARYPSVDIKHIEGAAGDQGRDVISGQLDEDPTIWQCKSFPNGVKKSQKQQIRESLNKALKRFTPKRWVLCLSIDIDTAALRWFQKLRKSRAASTEVELWQASDTVHQLLYQHTIRERFFPNAVLNTAELRHIVTKTAELTTEELATLSVENLDLYLHRLQEHDARFTYAVTVTRDRKPAAPPTPGELLTIITGQSTLHVYPRDHEALRSRPPQGRFTLTDTGIEKFKEHLRTGRPQTLTPEEITGFTSDFDFLLPPVREQTRLTLSLAARPSQELIPLRVTFGKDSDAITYEYIPFQRTHAGAEQTTFESTANLPVRIILVLRDNGAGSISFRDTSAGSDVHDIQKFLRAITIAITTGRVEFYDLAKSKRFLEATLRGSLPKWIEHYSALIDAAVIVANTYNVRLTKPPLPTPEDAERLYLLRQLATGLTMHVNEIGLGLSKVTGTAPSLRAALAGECSYRIITSGENVIVFGTTVPTGPLEYEVSRARIKNVADLLEYLDHAPLGAPTDIVLAPTGPISARRHAEPHAQPVLQFKPLNAGPAPNKPEAERPNGRGGGKTSDRERKGKRVAARKPKPRPGKKRNAR
jgi:hypothetical protein